MKHLPLVSSLLTLNLLACGGTVEGGATDGGHDVTRSSLASSISVFGSGTGSGTATLPTTSFGPPPSSASTTFTTTSSFTFGSSGFGGSTTSTSQLSSTECYRAPVAVYPEDGGAGVYCPFSATTDGGASVYCPIGEHCCEPPGKDVGVASTCEPPAMLCGTDFTDWQCEGTPDCVNQGKPGTLCCGVGKILEQASQPGCGPGGNTVPPFPYVSGFVGTVCQTSCSAVGDGGAPGFQVCSKDSECAASSCVPINPKGNAIGYCGEPPDGG